MLNDEEATVLKEKTRRWTFLAIREHGTSQWDFEPAANSFAEFLKSLAK